MKIYSAALTDDITTAPSLNAAYIGFPEVLERVTRQICNEYNFYFTGMALGYGRYVTEGEIKSNNDKLRIANDNVTWAVMPRVRQLVTLAANISSGSGGSGAGITITLSSADNWIKPGMSLRYTYAATGSSILFYVVSGPSANSSNWDYVVKIESSSTTTVPTTIASGQKLGFTSIAQASCAATTTYMPVKFYDQYRNYNTTMKPKHTLCKDGIATVTWYVSEDGQKCWAPQEEHQFEMESLKSLEYGIVYNVSTVNSSGTVYLTDANGDSVMKGDGLLAQIASGNAITYNINTYYQQPANYNAFLNIFEEAIENWSIQYGVTNSVVLYVHTGKKGFGLLQNVLKDYADQSGGCCFLTNYRNGGTEEMGLTKNIIRYKFSSYEIVLLNCSIFDDPGVHGTTQSGVTVGNAPPLESFRMLVCPDTDCDGMPLMQLFFRGGCGLDDIWNNSYTPGTIDPYNQYKKARISVTDYSGYDVKKEIEWNYILRDPSKILHWIPYQS